MFVITEDWFRTTQRQQQVFQSGVTQTQGNRGPEHKDGRISPITRLRLREQVSWLRASSPLSPFLPSDVPAPKGKGQGGPLPDPLDTRPEQGRGALTQGPGAKSCHLKSRCSLPISVTSPFLVPALLMMRPQSCIFCFLSVPSASRTRSKTPGTSVPSLGSWSACGWLKPLSLL